MNHEQQQPPVEQNLENPRPPTGYETVTKISDLQRMNIDQLQGYARSIGLKHTASLTKSQVVFEVVKTISDRPNEVLYGEGVLEILPDGFGFLRSPNYNYLPSAEDIYVSPAQIRRFDLRKGDTLYGSIRAPKDKEKYFAMLKVDRINNKTFEQTRDRLLFENLTPLYPEKRLVMETACPSSRSTRRRQGTLRPRDGQRHRRVARCSRRPRARSSSRCPGCRRADPTPRARPLPPRRRRGCRCLDRSSR